MKQKTTEREEKRCLTSIVSTCMHIQVHTPSSVSKEKKSNSTANQTHLCAKWGVLAAARSSSNVTTLQVSAGLNKTHESIQDVHSSSHPSHPIKVKQQKLGMKLIFLPHSLFSPQASQSELASHTNVFIIQMATLSVAVTCHALFSTVPSSLKQTNRANSKQSKWQTLIA